MAASLKILVLIVTYNRMNDLIVCVDALRNQTYRNFDILVINNGSTDGTKDWLSTQNDIISVHQENLGGAGGFYTGMKYMMNHHYGFLVMMDDDGIPDKDEIKELVQSYDKIKKKEGKDILLNALVVDKDDHQHTSFSWARGSGRSKVVEELKKIPYFEDIHPFNGTLVSREVIEKIGLIKKEMFIWGDEKEYMSRAKHNGVGLYTLTSALHYHPKERGVLGNIIPFVSKYQIVLKPKKFSRYFYRNEAFIYSHYPERRKRLWPFFGAYVIRFISHFEFKELWTFIIYFRKGVKNQYDN